MGKGLRSKAKRKNRNEFRNTIGQEAANKNMAKVQEKLQECIDKGSMNSFERISKILSGDTSNGNASGSSCKMQIDLKPKPLVGKNPDRVPTGKKDIVTKSKIRGQRKGVRVNLRTSSKKKSKET